MNTLWDEISAVQEAENHEIEQSIKVKFTKAAVRKAINRSPASFLALCAVVRALKPHAGLLKQASSVIILRAPADWQLDLFSQAAEDLLRVDALPHRNRSKRVVINHPITTPGKFSDFDVGATFSRRHLIVVADSDTPLLPELEISLDVSIQLEVCNERDVLALARLRQTGELASGDVDFVRKQATNIVNAIFRFGQSAGRAIARLRDLEPKQREKFWEPSLDDLPGLGKAGAWGKELVQDIQAWREGKLSWSEIDKGVLLHGPPGTGKTVFARALAKTCRMNFIPTSLGHWQSHGHLGDMLKAMHKSFHRARNEAPSILFLDEVDSIGDRGKFAHHNENYSTQVVNALLELVDGSFDREGVLVVGACNSPEKIDRALLRSGRLERHIYFGHPDMDGREQIIAYYLPELAGTDELRSIANRLIDWTHADLNKLSRDAKQQARRDSRQIATIEDLYAVLPPTTALPRDIIERIAIHEAGHAICALVHGLDIAHVSITREHDGADRSGALGVTVPVPSQSIIAIEDDITKQISVLLAGMAAEEVVLKSRSSTAGGEKESDLEVATQLAFRYLAALGLGETLSFVIGSSVDDLRSDLALRRKVDALLEKEYEGAKSIIKDWARAVAEIAAILIDHGQISGQRAKEIISRRQSQAILSGLNGKN
ncbi:AAA family ATPase [Sinorhizobium fredii]|uniref:AAA family ATPase n=1 Tax=Rhizobium fredii TaxID=380 RepID=UPI003512E148